MDNNKKEDKKELTPEEKEELIRQYERKMKKGSDYSITKDKKKNINNDNVCDRHWDGA